MALSGRRPNHKRTSWFSVQEALGQEDEAVVIRSAVVWGAEGLAERGRVCVLGGQAPGPETKQRL